jgi:SAM-dependent methyltransferase
MSNTDDKYYKSGQYDPDPRRAVVWKEIIKFLLPYIPENSAVVDLGSGYCDFINQVKAVKKYAVDHSPALSDFAEENVEKINSSAWDISAIATVSIDVVHSSNLFEHFTDEELGQTMNEVRRILKSGGRLVLIQPNYWLSPGHYFDDHTHKKIFTDSSLESFLLENGFKIILKMPRFLPLEVKNSPSFLPHFLLPFLIRAYIHSPIKPFAGQMLFVAEKM